MGYALKIPLIAIDALTSLTKQAQNKHSNINLCAVIDARRMEVYNLFVSSSGEPLKEISADIIDVASYEDYRPFVYFGDGAKKLSEIWEGLDCKIDESIKSSATGHIELAFEKYENN